MVSINATTTNSFVLSSLRQTNAELSTTQNRIASGLKVASARDNASVWSTAQTIRTDLKAQDTVNGSTAATVRTSTFAVPTAARNGKTRLRVVLSYTASTGPCDAYSYGETEDYSITVTGGTTAPTLDGDDLAATPNALTTTLDARAELSLYPNPAADQLHLSLSSGAELKAVEVLDVRGAKATVQYLGSGEISVSSLAPGLYLLRATDGQNTFVKHFAKQ